MCGIAGLLSHPPGLSAEELTAIASVMAGCVRHRGPDDEGTWADPEAGVGLGHQRLSIIDLSTAGHQPMVSADGRYVLSFNGEIYNFHAIRSDLASRGVGFRGKSDTEVLVEAVALDGLRATLSTLNGMFAFALWDRVDRALHLVRDRVGEKPLYVGVTRSGHVFGSELKALVAAPGFDRTIDRDALTSYFRWGYVPAARTIYRDAWKVRPGTVETYRVAAGGGIERTSVAYWSLADAARATRREDLTHAEAEDELERLLLDSTGLRSFADVPVGAFLSGGIDSSLVVALMQRQRTAPVRTFTVGFTEKSHDESRFAAEVARHLGTSHTELTVTPAESLSIIPHLPEIFDEPFGDPSAVPTALVSLLARQHVTVALSGDGGDELFGGYARYGQASAVWQRLRRVPTPARSAARRMLKSVHERGWERILRSTPLPQMVGVGSLTGRGVHRGADLLAVASFARLYASLLSHHPEPGSVVPGGVEVATSYCHDPTREAMPIAEQMMLADAEVYLPDDILVKVDRAAMWTGLEGRMPLLDHRLIEWAWTLPAELRFDRRSPKSLLRGVLRRHVPDSLFDRPKMGFGVPIDEWLRGPLRTWAEDLLSPESLGRRGLLDVAAVRTSWDDHLTGRRNLQYHLWDVLMFQAWCERR